MSLRHRLNHHGSRRPPQLLQSQQQQPPPPPQAQPSPSNQSPSPFGTSFRYQRAVMDDLSVDLGHPVGYFDSVKGSMRQIYHLLIVAICRHDPLPRLIRKAIESSLISATSRLQPTLQGSIEQHKSDIETITALDIPYTLRHFDFDLSVNNSEVSVPEPHGRSVAGAATAATAAVATAATAAAAATSAGAGGSVSFSLSEIRTGRAATVGSGSMRACHLLADTLVAGGLKVAVRRTVEDSTSCLGVGSSSLICGTYAPPNSSAFGTSPATSSSNGAGAAVVAGATMSLSAPLMLAIGMDGSNSNRATFQGQQQAAAAAAAAGRLCPLHSDRSGSPASESSCAVCASQHFLQRHLQRLAQESGGLSRLEEVLSDCLRLQEQWRHSVNWVAGSVRDKRLPESLRPLMQCICTDTVCCDPGGGFSRGVTVNPQIIISTDGHCSAVQCVNRCGGGGGGGCGGGCGARWGGGNGGGGSGGGGNCCL